VAVIVISGSFAFEEMDVLGAASIVQVYCRTRALTDFMKMPFRRIGPRADAMIMVPAAAYGFSAHTGKSMVMPVASPFGKFSTALKFVHVTLIFGCIGAAPAS
jgi:hypothetical protein